MWGSDYVPCSKPVNVKGTAQDPADPCMRVSYSEFLSGYELDGRSRSYLDGCDTSYFYGRRVTS